MGSDAPVAATAKELGQPSVSPQGGSSRLERVGIMRMDANPLCGPDDSKQSDESKPVVASELVLDTRASRQQHLQRSYSWRGQTWTSGSRSSVMEPP